MLITERSTYMECLSVTLAELLLAACKRVYAAVTVASVFADRARQRRALAALDDRLLADIGLSRTDVVRETSKPFWKE